MLTGEPTWLIDAWHTDNNIQNYEGYYASVFYSYIASLGLDVTVEDIASLGKVGMPLELMSEGTALQQLRDKAYADKYRGLNQPIYLIGVEFSKDSRNVESFGVEQIN